MLENTEQYRSSIKQIASSIEEEPLMKEMRTDISTGILKTGERQADLELEFKKVQEDSTTLNPSGAEIVAARGAYSTVAQRLETEEYKTTVALETIENDKINRNESESISMDMLGPTVKAAITNGEWSWAINTSDLADGAVSIDKTSFLEATPANDATTSVMPGSLSARGNYIEPATGVMTNTPSTQNFKNTGKIFTPLSGVLELSGMHSLICFSANGTVLAYSTHGTDNELPVKRRMILPKDTSYVMGNIPSPYWWDSDDTQWPNLTATLMFTPSKSKMEDLRLVPENYAKVLDPGFSPKYLNPSFNMTAPGHVIDVTTGVSNVQADRMHSTWGPALDVEYGTLGVAHILFKNAEGKFMPKYYNYNNDAALSTLQTWKPPAGAVSMAFNLVKFYFNRAEFFQLTTNVKRSQVENSDLDSKIKSMFPLHGKKVMMTGDSIIGNPSFPSDIPSIVAQKTMAQVFNAGFGGTQASKHPNQYFNPFSLFNIVDAFISGNWSTQESAANITGQGVPGYFKNKVAMLKSESLKNYDIFTISALTNDWNDVTTLDNASNPMDTTTYAGALRYSISRLQTAFPNLQIIISTGIYRFAEDGSKDSDTWLAGTKKITDFNAVVEAVAKEFKIIVVDLYNEMGISKYNRLQFFDPVDGTHPIYPGRVRQANLMADGMLRLN